MKEKSNWNSADMIVPILAVFLALYYLYTIRGIPRMAQMYGGTLSIAVLALSFVTTILVAKNGAFKKENLNFAALKQYKKVSILILFVALYMVIIPYLGYPITSIVFMTVVMYFLGMRNIPKILGVAIFVTLIGFGLFVLFLNVQLPLDVVSQQIKHLIR